MLSLCHALSLIPSHTPSPTPSYPPSQSYATPTSTFRSLTPVAEGRARVGDFFFEFTLGRGQRGRATPTPPLRAVAGGGAFVYAGGDGVLQTVEEVEGDIAPGVAVASNAGDGDDGGGGERKNDDSPTNKGAEAEGEGDEEYDDYVYEDGEGGVGGEGSVRVTDRGVVVGNVVLEGTGVWLNTKGKDSDAKEGSDGLSGSSPVPGGGTASEKGVGVESKVAAVSGENPSDKLLPAPTHDTDSLRVMTTSAASANASDNSSSTGATTTGANTDVSVSAIPTTSATSATATTTTTTISAGEASSAASPSPSPSAVSLRDLRAGWLAKNIIGKDI